MKKHYSLNGKLFVFLFLLLCLCNTINAQTLNPSSISTNGTVNTIVQDSTFIYIGGTFSTVGYKSAGVALINSEGKNIIGFPSISPGVTVSISDGNGGWYIGGNFTYQGKNDLIHILSNNTLDINFTFSSNSGGVNDILLDGNTLFIGGSFTQVNAQNIPYLASIDAITGVVNSNWNPNPNSRVNSIKKDGNTLFIGGNFSKIGERGQTGFAAINANTGQLLQSISTEREVNTINQDADNVYIGGRSICCADFTGDNGFNTGYSTLLTTNSDIPDATFPQFGGFVNNPGSSSVSVPDGSGGWYIGGYFTYQSIDNLIHILADNTVDLNFAPNPGRVNALVLDGNRLYVGGRFSQIGGQNISYLAAINAIDGSVDTSWNPSPSFEVFSIAKDGNQLYVGGNFDSIGGKEYKYFAVVDTTSGAVIPSISTAGKVNVIKYDNENIYVGGDFAGECGYFTADCALVPSNSDVPNLNFPKLNGINYCSVSDGNGGWFIGGSFTYQTYTNLVHILPDNTIDASFAPNPNSKVSNLFLDNGILYIGGQFTQIGGQNVSYLVRYNVALNTVDASWNLAPNNFVDRVLVNGSTLYISGTFSQVLGLTRNKLAAIDIPSATVLNWDPNPNAAVNDFTVVSNNLIVAGSFTSIGGQTRNRLAAIDSSTGLATSWNPNANGAIATIKLNGSTLLAGGSFTLIGGQSRNRIAEVDITTGLSTSFNPNCNGAVNDIEVIGTSVYIGGNFSSVSGQTRNNLAAINSSDSSLLLWNPNSNGTINALETDGTNLCLLGNFSMLKVETRNRFLAISKSNNLINTLNPAPNSIVNAIELNGTKMYIGGGFSTIAGQSRSRIAEIDISSGQPTSWNPNANTIVNCIKLVGATVYVGGDFTSIGGQPRNYLAAIDSSDGTASSWSPEPNDKVYGISYDGLKLNILGGFTLMKTENRISLLSISKATGLITDWNPSPNNNTIIEALDIVPNTAYVSGNFTQIGGQQRNELVELDLTTGLATAWNPNPNNGVNCIKLINGIVYVGGSFTSIGGQTRNNLSALNATDGTPIPWNPKPNGTVYDIKQAGQNIMISGSFSFTNSESRSNLFKISKADNLITDWIPNPNNTVQTIELDGNTVYTGGLFTTIGGQSRNRIAAIDSQTGLASNWNPNSNALVKTMKLSGNTLYVGGSFTTIGGQSRTNLAGLDTSTGTATTWSPNPNAIVNKVGVSNGILYTAGNFTSIAGQPRNRLASFTTNDDVLTSWDPNVSGAINDLFITDSSLYIGGSFSQVTGQTRNKVASFSKSSGGLRNWNPSLSGTVNSIAAIGKYVFVGGSVTSSGGQACQGFTMINANTSFPQLFFPSITGGIINTISANRNELYLGGGFTGINLNSYGGLASISYLDSYFNPIVDNVFPLSGSLGGIVSVAITGNGFVDGTTVTFTKAGEQDIVIPLNVTTISDNIRISIVLDLNNPVALGMWNIKVSIPNENTIILPNAFEVIASAPISLQTNIIGSTTIRPNTWQPYSVIVNNNGSNDVTGVPVYILVDNSVDIDFISGITVADEFGNIIPSDIEENFTPVDNLFGSSNNQKVYSILVPHIPANQNSFINFKLKSAGNNFTIKTWHDKPINSATALIPVNLIPGWAECATDVLDQVMGFAPEPVSCAFEVISAAISPAVNAAITGETDTRSVLIDYFSGMGDAIFECYGGIEETYRLLKTREFFLKIYRFADEFNTALENITTCIETIPIAQPSIANINVVNSSDPNEKQGPLGIGTEHYYNPKNTIPYIIRFENIPDATAPAQTVVVEDILDSDVFDLSSFQLGFITIKDSIIDIPAGLKHYETDFDLRPENNIIARIVADFNQTTGLARWTFTSIDPVTLLETTEPLAGIIPPNINAPEGEGAVMFTIKPLSTIGHDIQILNEASITFDTNVPIITNEWLNTSDIIKPQSQISNNPIIQNDGVTIDLSWSGSDIGSGVRSYAIYYSINGGAFEILANFVTSTTYTFIGELNNSYSFFTIATDNVGNVEDMKTMGEAQVTLGINQNELFKGISVYPNPNQGNFTLFVNSNENVVAEISITDILGRVIYEKKQELNTGDNYVPINLTNDGIYILNLIENGNKLSKKIIVKK